jgi:hypothetical protein
MGLFIGDFSGNKSDFSVQSAADRAQPPVCTRVKNHQLKLVAF